MMFRENKNRSISHECRDGYKETDKINEVIDSLDERLTDLSDNLKQRYRHLVISQLSLIEYQDKTKTQRETKSPTRSKHLKKVENEDKRQNNVQPSINNTRKDVNELNNSRFAHTKEINNVVKYINKTKLNHVKCRMKENASKSPYLSTSDKTGEANKKLVSPIIHIDNKSNESAERSQDRRVSFLLQSNQDQEIGKVTQTTTRSFGGITSSIGRHEADTDSCVERKQVIHTSIDRRKENLSEETKRDVYNQYMNKRATQKANGRPSYSPRQEDNECSSDSLHSQNKYSKEQPATVIDRLIIRKANDQNNICGSPSTFRGNTVLDVHTFDNVQVKRMPNGCENAPTGNNGLDLSGMENSTCERTKFNILNEKFELGNHLIQQGTGHNSSRKENIPNYVGINFPKEGMGENEQSKSDVKYPYSKIDEIINKNSTKYSSKPVEISEKKICVGDTEVDEEMVQTTHSDKLSKQDRPTKQRRNAVKNCLLWHTDQHSTVLADKDEPEDVKVRLVDMLKLDNATDNNTSKSERYTVENKFRIAQNIVRDLNSKVKSPTDRYDRQNYLGANSDQTNKTTQSNQCKYDTSCEHVSSDPMYLAKQKTYFENSKRYFDHNRDPETDKTKYKYTVDSLPTSSPNKDKDSQKQTTATDDLNIKQGTDHYSPRKENIPNYVLINSPKEGMSEHEECTLDVAYPIAKIEEITNKNSTKYSSKPVEISEKKICIGDTEIDEEMVQPTHNDTLSKQENSSKRRWNAVKNCLLWHTDHHSPVLADKDETEDVRMRPFGMLKQDNVPDNNTPETERYTVENKFRIAQTFDKDLNTKGKPPTDSYDRHYYIGAYSDQTNKTQPNQCKYDTACENESSDQMYLAKQNTYFENSESYFDHNRDPETDKTKYKYTVDSLPTSSPNKDKDIQKQTTATDDLNIKQCTDHYSPRKEKIPNYVLINSPKEGRGEHEECKRDVTYPYSKIDEMINKSSTKYRYKPVEINEKKISIDDKERDEEMGQTTHNDNLLKQGKSSKRRWNAVKNCLLWHTDQHSPVLVDKDEPEDVRVRPVDMLKLDNAADNNTSESERYTVENKLRIAQNIVRDLNSKVKSPADRYDRQNYLSSNSDQTIETQPNQCKYDTSCENESSDPMYLAKQKTYSEYGESYLDHNRDSETEKTKYKYTVDSLPTSSTDKDQNIQQHTTATDDSNIKCEFEMGHSTYRALQEKMYISIVTALCSKLTETATETFQQTFNSEFCTASQYLNYKVQQHIQEVIKKLKKTSQLDHVKDLERAEIRLTYEIDRIGTNFDQSRTRSDLYKLIEQLKTMAIRSGNQQCRQAVLNDLQPIEPTACEMTDMRPTSLEGPDNIQPQMTNDRSKYVTRDCVQRAAPPEGAHTNYIGNIRSRPNTTTNSSELTPDIVQDMHFDTFRSKPLLIFGAFLSCLILYLVYEHSYTCIPDTYIRLLNYLNCNTRLVHCGTPVV